MRRSELPVEANRRPLTYAELLDVLGALTGECVIARGDASDEAPGAGDPPGLGVTGVLAIEPGAGADEAVVSIGASGRLRISAASVNQATLTTFDGNDFVIVRLQMPGLTIQIQDENSGAL